MQITCCKYSFLHFAGISIFLWIFIDRDPGLEIFHCNIHSKNLFFIQVSFISPLIFMIIGWDYLLGKLKLWIPLALLTPNHLPNHQPIVKYFHHQLSSECIFECFLVESRGKYWTLFKNPAESWGNFFPIIFPSSLFS